MDGKVDGDDLMRLQNAIRVGDWRFIKNLKLPPKPIKVIRKPEKKPAVAPVKKPAVVKPVDSHEIKRERGLLYDRNNRKRAGVTNEQTARWRKRRDAVYHAEAEYTGRGRNRKSIKAWVDGYISKGWRPTDADRPYILLSPEGQSAGLPVGVNKAAFAKNYMDVVFDRGNLARNYDVPEKPPKPVIDPTLRGENIAKKIVDIKKKVFDPEAKVLMKEARELRKQMEAIPEADHRRELVYRDVIQKERKAQNLNRRIRRKEREGVLELLKADVPSKIDAVGVDKLEARLGERVKEGIASVERAFSGAIQLDREFVNFERISDDRANFSPRSNAVRVGRHSDAKSVAHELGHWIEYSNRDARHAVKDFLARRTKGEKPQKLDDLKPGRGYEDDEVCKPDKFFSPYIGKIYSDGATEVLSMGIAEYIKNPVWFCEHDPEHFALIHDICKGYI